MKKFFIVFSIATLLFSANFTGFNSHVTVPDLTEISMASTDNMILNYITGVGTINLLVSSNLDNWQILVDSDYRGPRHSVSGHIMTSNVAITTLNGIPSYLPLALTSNVTTASKLVYTGMFNYGTPSTLTVYLQLQNPQQARVGYYTTYLNMRVFTQ